MLRRACRRHVLNRLRLILCRRATSASCAPGSNLSAKIAPFSSPVHRLPRASPVITSMRRLMPSLMAVLVAPIEVAAGAPHSDIRSARAPAQHAKFLASLLMSGVGRAQHAKSSRPSRGLLCLVPSLQQVWAFRRDSQRLGDTRRARTSNAEHDRRPFRRHWDWKARRWPGNCHARNFKTYGPRCCDQARRSAPLAYSRRGSSGVIQCAPR